MSRPPLLDLFCGQGGAGMGYHRAGFDVFGVDLSGPALARYPFRRHRGDALAFLAAHGADFAAVHASPPCKVHTKMSAVLGAEDLDGMLFPMATHTDLVADTRAALAELGRPWIMENVPGAPLLDPVTLCGTMFGLAADTALGRRELRRHRLFESPVPLAAPGPCAHQLPAVGVYGHGARRWKLGRGAYQGSVPENRVAMGMPWAGRDGLSQAIPPAYTECLGRQLLAALTADPAGSVPILS